MQTMSASLASFLSPCRPVMRRLLTHNHNALTNHLGVWKRHRKSKNHDNASKHSSSSPEISHHSCPWGRDSWLEKSLSVRLKTNFQDWRALKLSYRKQKLLSYKNDFLLSSYVSIPEKILKTNDSLKQLHIILLIFTTVWWTSAYQEIRLFLWGGLIQ